MASTNELRELDCDDITCDLRKFVAGSGSFGDVLIGYHNGLKQHVAIKVFEMAGGTNEKSLAVKMIKDEMEHLLKAGHENVVRIFGYVQWSFAMGIVMEYCKGGDLETLLMDTSKELGLAVRVRILHEIASAMAFCHNLPDKRLIHQDLKPGNILLTEELCCKLADFGSAELATHSTSATVNPLARTKKERPQFTPYYTAPEKLKDLTIKPRKEHDVYALAMIIHWLLARKAPYPRLAEEERRELLEQIKRGKRPDCQEIQDWIQTLVGEDREIAEQLQLLMKRCWDQDPTKRPTMTRIKEEIKTYLEKQRNTKLLSQVLTTLTQMDLDEQPQVSEGQRVPIHYFSTRSRSFHVPFTSVDTAERSNEPPAGAQEHRQSHSFQQGEILSSSSAQKPDSIRHGDAKRPTAPRKEIAHSSSTSPQQSAEESGGFNQLVQQYVDFLKTKKYDEAKTTKQQLLRLCESQLGVIPKNLEDEATKRRNDGKYLESILFFSITADFYVKKKPDSAVARSVAVCAFEIQETIQLLMQNSKIISKSRNRKIVRNHVIPLMRDMIQQIRDLQINEEIRCKWEVWCLHRIEQGQYYIGDLASSETTIKLGLELMETKFGNKSSKYEIYGVLLHNLGFICQETSQFKEAVKYFTKAIEVYKTAEDLYQQQRREYIANSETSLQFNKAKLNK